MQVKRMILPIICGIICALPVVLPSVGYLQWISLVPFGLMCFLGEVGRARREFFRGFLFYVSFYTVCYSFFLSMYPLSVTEMSKVAALFVVIFATLGISAFQALGFSLVFLLIRVGKKRGLPIFLLPFFAGALWSIGEWLQNFFWFGLPWVKLALGQTEVAELYRSSNLFGSYFVSFLLVSVNLFLALSVISKRKGKKLVAAVIALVLFLSNALYGIIDVRIASEKKYDSVKISAFQGNISTEEKWGAHMLDYSLELYEKLLVEASCAGAQYVLFAETVIPYVTEEQWEVDSFFSDLAWRFDITLMLGTFGRVEGEIGNVIRVYEPMKDAKNVYTKQRPVPFGEYIPMRGVLTSLIPPLGEINILDRSLAPGRESSVWRDDNATFGYLICFDSIYSDLARKSVASGAEVLMISTNDAWFDGSVGLEMHLAHAKLRAVENGRSVVRAANTGISAIIDPVGNILQSIENGEVGQISCNVPLSRDLTVYCRIGDLFVYLSVIFASLCLASPMGKLARRRDLRRQMNDVRRD